MRNTISSIRKLKKNNEKIVCTTCYDASFAAIQDSHVDLMLVGDSLGMVIQGNDDTLKVSVADIVYHCKAVAKGSTKAMIMADTPFLSCVDNQHAFDTCKKLISEGGAQIIKLEQNESQVELVQLLSSQGIAVCCHLGVQPQFILSTGNYKYQGDTSATAKRLYQQAITLEKLGAAMLLLECVPQQLAKKITKALTIPVIGIGSGKEVDGQILVLYDIIGISNKIPPFAKTYNTKTIENAIATYAAEVRNNIFPTDKYILH